MKTYPKAEDDVVMMDWRFSFTPNDTADMTSRQVKNKVNPQGRSEDTHRKGNDRIRAWMSSV